MPSVPGCIEHYTKLDAAASEAHSHRKSLCVCWLDLANAYGSVHHNLIDFSLKYIIMLLPNLPISSQIFIMV